MKTAMLRRIVSSFLFPFYLLFITTALSAAPLHDAVTSRNRTAVARLLAQGDDPNQHDGDGITALHWAIRANQPAIVELLLAEGADSQLATIPPEESGYTPLHFAAFAGNETIAQLLLDSGANVNARSNFGDTPLHIASAQGDEEMRSLLLDSGASVALRNKAGERAADVATAEFLELLTIDNSGFYIRPLAALAYNFLAPSLLIFARSSLQLGAQLVWRLPPDTFAWKIVDIRLEGQALSPTGTLEPQFYLYLISHLPIPFFSGYIGNSDVVWEYYAANVGAVLHLNTGNLGVQYSATTNLTFSAINSTFFVDVFLNFLFSGSVIPRNISLASLDLKLVIGYVYQFKL